MARRIEKGDLRSFVIHRVGADVLGDPAGFIRRDVGLSNRIHERRLAVVDVSHESDDGSARLEFFLSLNDRRRWRDHYFLDLVHSAAFFAAFHLEDKTVLGANLRRDVRLDGLILIRENVQLHQLLDQDVVLDPELNRQIAHNDRRLDVNDLLRLFFGCRRSLRSLSRRRFNRRGRDSRRSGRRRRVVVRNEIGHSRSHTARGWTRWRFDRLRRRWGLSCGRDNAGDRGQKGTDRAFLAFCSFRPRLLFVDQRNSLNRLTLCRCW